MIRQTMAVLDYENDPFSIEDVEEKLDAFDPQFLCPLCDQPNDSSCIVVPAHESLCLVHRQCLEDQVGFDRLEEEDDYDEEIPDGLE